MGGHAMMTGSVLKEFKMLLLYVRILSLDDLGFESENISTLSNHYTTSFFTPPSPSPSHQSTIRQKDTEPFSGWSLLLRPTRALSGLSNLNFSLASLVLTAVLTASRLPQLQLSCHFDFLLGYLTDRLSGFSQAIRRDGGDDGDDERPIANLLR